MQKIPTIWKRNYDTDKLIRDEPSEGLEWFFAGEGTVTRKIDGTACLVRDGKLYKRYDAKQGKKPPLDFMPAQAEADPVTGHWPGWVPVSANTREDRWHIAAWKAQRESLNDWTYELVGPKVQDNPEHTYEYDLVRHGSIILFNFPRTFEETKAYLARYAMEGIVAWRDIKNPDCDKCKVKAHDFGIKWPREVWP